MTEPRRRLVDGFGRRHNNLRVSVTDRCNLRCTYCMPEDVEFLPKDHLLTFEEMARFVRVAAGEGIDKLRITGGEPLLRQDLPTLVRMITAIPGIKDIGLTTNGLLLAKLAQPLFDAGLRRLNISLDTLDNEQFKVIARRDGIERVLAGIHAAKAVGFDQSQDQRGGVKNVTDDQVVRLARFCRDEGLELRFIEFMPLPLKPTASGTAAKSSPPRSSPSSNTPHLPVAPVPGDDPHAPATDYEYTDGGGRIGIVASVSQPFCGTCNRLRITAEGKLRNCLFALDEIDIREPLRCGADDAEIADLLNASVSRKWAGHLINSVQFVRPPRTMHTIGVRALIRVACWRRKYWACSDRQNDPYGI